MRFVQNFARQMLAGITILAAFTVVLGIGYPAAVWAISRIDTHAAEGSALRTADGCVVGSSLIGTDPQVEPGAPDPYFHPRETAPGPTNLGPSSEMLASSIEERRVRVAERESIDPADVPVDAVTGSGSGIDPHISPAYAAVQVQRVAQVNELSLAEVETLVAEHTDGPQYGVLGASRVNVPELNFALGPTPSACTTG